MSEISLNLYSVIENKDFYNSIEKGFKLIAEDKFAEAKAHFSEIDVDLLIDTNSPSWAIESLDSSSNIKLLDVMILAPQSNIDKLKSLLKIISKNFDSTVLGVFKTETGDGENLAFSKGKRSSVPKAMKYFGEFKPELALEIALDARRNNDIKKILQLGVNPNIEIGSMPLIHYFLDNGTMLVELFSSGASIDVEKYGSVEIYSEALFEGRYKVFNILIDEKVNPNLLNENYGDLTVLDYLLKNEDLMFSYVEHLSLIKRLFGIGGRPHYYSHRVSSESPILRVIDIVSPAFTAKEKYKKIDELVGLVKNIFKLFSVDHFDLKKKNEHADEVLRVTKSISPELVLFLKDEFELG